MSGSVAGGRCLTGGERQLRVDPASSKLRMQTAAFGAFEPFPDAPAKVSSPNRQRSLGPGRGNRTLSSTQFLLSAQPTPESCEKACDRSAPHCPLNPADAASP